MQKAKRIVSMEKLPPEILDTMKTVYPGGFERNIMRVEYPSKGVVFVVPLETDDTTYLIKVNPDLIVDNKAADDDDDSGDDDTDYKVMDIEKDNDEDDDNENDEYGDDDDDDM